MNIYINNKEITKFTRYNVNSIFNALGSTFSIVIDNSLTDIEVMKEQDVVFKNNGQTVLTGTVKNIGITASPKGNTVTISGYSTGAVLQEVQPKDTDFQYKQIMLKDLAETLCNPHGIKVFFSPIAKKKYLDKYGIKEIEFEETDKIKDILMKASKQLGLIIRHDERGGVLFTYPDVDDKTVADISSVTTLNVKYNTQNLYSELVMIDDLNAGDVFNTYKNPQTEVLSTGINVDRTLTFKSTFADKEVSTLEILGKRGLQYKGIVVGATIWGTDVDMLDKGWINKESGVLIAGDVVSLQSDVLRIKNKTRFMILKNDISGTSKGVDSKLTLIPHEAYTNKEISKFWL